MRWSLRRLEELAVPGTGAIKIGPFGSQLKREELVDDGVHVVGIENVLARKFDGLGRRFVTKEKYHALRSVEVRPGDVVITMMGTVGEVAVVPAETGVSIMDSHLLRFRPNLEVCLPEFVAWFLRSPNARAAVNSRAHGAIMKGLNSAIVRSLPVPLPPLSEQRRIIEILDQADRLRHLRAEADAKAGGILPALLTRVLGLVSTWDSDPRSRSLGELVDFVSGGTPSKGDDRFWDGEVPWVSPKDMKEDFIHDTQDHISRDALDEVNLRIIEPESILIVVRGMILARTVPLSLNLTRVTINQDMKALVPKESDVSGRYVWAALYLARTRLSAMVSTAGHGTRKLDTPDLIQFPIIVPATEQRRLVESAVHAHQSDLQKRRQTGLHIKQLFSRLLHQAFSGELTVSWREAHMKGLLEEMEHQAKALAATALPE